MQRAARIISLTSPCLLLVLLPVGCTSPAPLQFTAGSELKALPDSGVDDEEKKKLVQLQKQVEAELSRRFGTAAKPLVPSDSKADAGQLARGAEVFAFRCVQCHGVNGDGQGKVAQYLYPLPRDYTKGVFKFTSTPYGAKPRRADLLRTLKAGVGGTSMPAFEDLDPADLNAVVEYVIYLSQRGELEQKLVALAKDELELEPAAAQETLDTVLGRWHEAQSQAVMPATPMPPMTAETIAKGRELYLQRACNKCHGIDGRGGLVNKIDIGKDAWGHAAFAADLTSGMYRGGGRPIDIYRRIYSGINGTPMPGFAQAFANDPNNFWYLVHFVRDTGERRRRNEPPPPEQTPATLAPSAESGAATTPDTAPAAESKSAGAETPAAKN